MKEEKSKILIIGDYERAPYHPLGPVEPYFKEALENCFELTFTEDREMLNSASLNNYKVCISYVDTWGEKLPEDKLGALLAYVAQGGSFIVVHSGIAYQSSREYSQLVQAKFVGHPPYQPLDFQVKDAEHPITRGLENFRMEEELYTFEFEKSFDASILMECTNGELTQPALWVHKYGEGKVVYLAPGHGSESFKNPSVLELIKRTSLWAAGDL